MPSPNAEIPTQDSDSDDDRRWGRVGDAAERAGVTTATIRRWCESGRLRHRRPPGGQRQIDLDHLEGLLAPTGGEDKDRGAAA